MVSRLLNYFKLAQIIIIDLDPLGPEGPVYSSETTVGR